MLTLRKRLGKVIRLGISIGLAQAAGVFGSIFTISAIPIWYEGLVKPSFQPPSWLFGPVWVVLYTLMGIAFYRLWEKGGIAPAFVRARLFFLVHLFFNALWSFLFFGFHMVGLALVDIVLLWVMIVVMIAWFYRLDRISAYLLVPYLVWVSFASVLNYAIFALN